MNIKRATVTFLITLLSTIVFVSLLPSLRAANLPKTLAQTTNACQAEVNHILNLELEQSRRQAELLNEMGDRCLEEENYNDAIRVYQQSLNILEDLLKTFNPIQRESLLTERRYLEGLYDLGFAQFRLAQHSPELKSAALADADEVLVKALDRLNVFKFASDSNGQSSARASFRDFGPDNLESRISRLLQRVLVDKGQFNDALLVAEAGRTIEVDKNILYHLFFLYNSRWTRLDWPGFLEISRRLSLKPTLEDVQHIAQTENATLVNYSVVADQEILVWVVQPTGQITFRTIPLNLPVTAFPEESSLPLPDRGQQQVALAQLIRGTRQSLGINELNSGQSAQDNPDRQHRYLQQLHQILIHPIEDLLPSNPESHIVILPYGPLFFVPFAALQNPSGQYLIEQHTIRTAPNLRTLLLNQSISSDPSLLQTSPKPKALIVGNPTMPSVRLTNNTDPQPLAPLPGAENEAREIAQLLRKQFDVTLLVNGQATEERITRQMEKAQIIHFATHAIIDTTPQELGGTTREASGAIALAPSGDDSHENGLLITSEILNLRLQADLVVLSACNTGRGQFTAGGVIGLPFSLSIAGARNIVVSLWSVPDASTEKLMLEFYTQIFKQGSDKARALRQAMLKLMQMEEFRNPLYWAAFSLTGAVD
jgi:CHAT domain-containing protein